MNMTTQSAQAYARGFKDGTIDDSINEIYNIVLEQRFQSFQIPLEVGLNTIDFKALNQGTSGPNTAGFKIYDDSGTLISANQWELATGAKATIAIAKSK